MGWLGDVFRWIGDGIKSAVNWVVDGITGLIEMVRKDIRIVKHTFGKWISSALDTTLGCIAVLLGMVGLAIGIIFFGEALAASSFLLSLRAARDKIKKSIIIVAESIKLKLILDTNKVLMAVWDDYRDIFSSLNTAFVGLSKELGFDTSTLLLIANLGKSAAINSLRFVGMDSKATELEVMTKTQTFLEKVDYEFNSYVLEPGKFMDDFDREILQPYYTEGDEAVGGLYKFLDELRNELTIKAGELWQVRQDLQGLQESLGPEIALKFDEHLGPYLEKFDAFYEDILTPTLDRVNAGFDTINEMQERNERKLEALEDSQNDPIIGLNKLAIMGIDDQRTFAAGLSNLNTFMVVQEYKKLTPFETELRDRKRSLIDSFSSNLNGPEFLRYEGGPIIPPKTPLRIKLTSWNVGEY